MNEIQPEFGIGITSDRYPGSICRVSDSGKTFWYFDDEFKRVDNGGPYTESQTYTYTPNPGRPEDATRVYKSKRGYWRDSKGSVIQIGSRRAYLDPCF